MIGQTISHYKITEKLGEGGMGVVYKARDTKLDRDVALKFLPQHLTSSEENKQRFIREAKAAAALNHPNICTIHNFDDHEGKQFIVMEYIEGETLREKIDGGALTLEVALDYAAKVADALAEAHQKDIIHRDIKPGNIMVDAKRHIKVMDFGLAKLTGTMDLTKTGSTLGTMPYMSPEQIQGEAIDHRSDIFSFGVVLYEMLTGQKPFRGEHEAAMTYAIVNEDPIAIRDLIPDAPEKLVEFFDQCLAKTPADRIVSAAEVKNRLETIKDLTGDYPKQTQGANAVNESKKQDRGSGSGSTTFSVTVPDGSFGGRAGLLAGVLALVLLAGWWFVGENVPENPEEASDAEITDRSIAVLPFENLGGEESEQFTHGVHDGLLTRLSNISDLDVISRTSVRQYEGTKLTLPEVADELGVQWIIEGAVQQAGGRVQVNAKLIDPDNDVQQWADSYQRDLTAENLFDLQSEITKSIATSLEAELSPEETERIERRPTADLNAYQLYVQGRHELARRVEGNMEEAVRLFQRAIERDSSFALAWSGLADAAGLRWWGFEGYDTLSVTPEEAARRALELDPDLAEAHASMGLVHYRQREGPAALDAFQRAVDLKPSYAEAHNWLGIAYLVLGRPNEGLRHLELARELNPQHLLARHYLYDVYISKGHTKQALEEIREQQRRYPDYTGPYVAETRALYGLGRYKETKSVLQDRLLPRDVSMYTAYHAGIETAMGDTTRARELLAKVEESDSPPIVLAYAYAAFSDVDATLSALERVEEWSYMPTFTLRYLTFPEGMGLIRDDLRYEELLREVNEYWGLNPDGNLPEEMKTR